MTDSRIRRTAIVLSLLVFAVLAAAALIAPGCGGEDAKQSNPLAQEKREVEDYLANIRAPWESFTSSMGEADAGMADYVTLSEYAHVVRQEVMIFSIFATAMDEVAPPTILASQHAKLVRSLERAAKAMDEVAAITEHAVATSHTQEQAQAHDAEILDLLEIRNSTGAWDVFIVALAEEMSWIGVQRPEWMYDIAVKVREMENN